MSRGVCRVLVALFAFGCARESVPAHDGRGVPYPVTGVVWPAAAYGQVPPSAPMFAGVGALDAQPPAAAGAPAAHPLTSMRLSSADIPGGNACLAELDTDGVKYARIEEKKGIETPIEVKGAIGGVQYDGGPGNPMVADCRFAVALYRIAPLLRDLGVSSMRFSGAYSYRMSRVGRLSFHAYGLAIDVHEMVVSGQRVSIEKDFARGLAYGCAPESPPLNRVACELKATGLFQELLTPDYNADHHNHFHFGIRPLGSDLPKPAKPVTTRPALAKAPTPAHPKPAAEEPAPAPEVDDEPSVVLDPEPAPTPAKAAKPDAPVEPAPPRPSAKGTKPAHKRPHRKAREAAHHGPKHSARSRRHKSRL